MPPNHLTLELLWTRLEESKQQLDLAHQRSIRIHGDKGAIPALDSYSARGNALRAEVAAVKNYLGALQDLNVALTLDERASGPIKQSLAAADGTHDAGITSREREVLRRIAAGRSSREIAAELGVAFRTVVCHRYRIYRKLKIHKTVDLVRAAMRMGLIEL